MSDVRQRCGTPCLNHDHACDRSPRHTGWHRDVQQKGDHACEWGTPGPKDFPAVMTALRSARAEVERLRAELARWEGHDAVTATLVRQAEAERDRHAEQVSRVREVAIYLRDREAGLKERHDQATNDAQATALLSSAALTGDAAYRIERALDGTQTAAESGADIVLDHIKQCHPDVAGLAVAQSGSLDEQVAEMEREGWTVERTEYVAGKRIRIMRPPAPPEAGAACDPDRSDSEEGRA